MDIVPIIAIIFGCTLAGYVFYKIIDLIKAWINRNKTPYDEEKFERLAKAFIQHKKENERRLNKLEANLNKDSSISFVKQNPKKQQQRTPIEIKPDNKEK